ncbi:MAG: sugar phosphate isomerase/epimerase family protein [Fuerstiella sp.]
MPTRRSFLNTTAAACAAALQPHSRTAAVTPAAADGQFTDRIRKAVKFHMITENLSALDKLKLLKDLGFDGVEPRAQLRADRAAEVRELARASEIADFPVHGVINSSNPDISGAIDQAKMLGADSVLHVVRYDQKISYLQNYRETQDIILRAVDHAEENQVHILIENVWASYLIEPLSMARFVDEINSPWVQVYFDVGNVVRWGWPQHWIEVLGRRIRKLDIKEYDLQVAMNEGMRAAFAKPLGQGSIEWDKVRAELLKIDYRGWTTAEVSGGDRKRLADIAEQMDSVLDL